MELFVFLIYVVLASKAVTSIYGYDLGVILAKINAQTGPFIGILVLKIIR